MFTVLEIVQSVMEELGMEPLKTLCKNENPIARQFLALLQAQGRLLLRQAPWDKIRRTHRFKTMRGKIQPDAVPDDFNHLIRDDRFPKLYSIANNLFRSHQDLIEEDYIQFDYISCNWVVDGDDGSKKKKITKDSDRILFDETLITQGLKWQFLKEKGLDYAADREIFNALISSVMAHNNSMSKASPMISLA